MYLALYRAYRPETFEEILGQDHIVKILKNQIKSNAVNHAYLFCGSRGTGKTTTARVLAKGVNCVSENGRPCGVCVNCDAIRAGIFLDVIEIDAASNNGVDNIRELRESVKYPPAVGRKKVYIIDEVHMLSTGAFNALLKTLEEPPEYVMFILATTEPRKLPPTILSRCMRLDFRRVSENLIIGGMEKICAERGIDISGQALKLIAMNADGSVRDGLSILDQCIASGGLKVTRDDVLELVGASGEDVFLELADKIKNGGTDEALLILDKALAGGKDARQFSRDLLAHYRNLMIVKFIKHPEDVLCVSCENAERIKLQSEGIPLADINRAIVEISKTAAEIKWSTQPRVLLELCIVMLSEGENVAVTEPVLKKSEGVPAGQKKTETERPKKKTEGGGDLWSSIFEGENGLRSTFSMLRDGAEIKSISDSEYIVAVSSDFVKGLIDKNKKSLEELLMKKTGVNRIIRCVDEEIKNAVKEEKSDSEFAAEVGNKLGISIEIEE